MKDGVTMDIVVDGLTLPEAPRWRDGRLWFSDFYSHRVFAMVVDSQGLCLCRQIRL